jgi:hypothetical protein
MAVIERCLFRKERERERKKKKVNSGGGFFFGAKSWREIHTLAVDFFYIFTAVANTP